MTDEDMSMYSKKGPKRKTPVTVPVQKESDQKPVKPETVATLEKKLKAQAREINQLKHEMQQLRSELRHVAAANKPRYGSSGTGSPFG